MIVIHFDSGLGNQMLTYCEYLALKVMNPDEEFYIETITFDIPECDKVIAQWNGYELEKIFGFNTPPNIKTIFSDEQWASIVNDVKASKFWENNWNYPVAITNALNRAGLNLVNVRGDFASDRPHVVIQSNSLKSRFKDSYIGEQIRRLIYWKDQKKHIASYENKENLFMKVDKDIFTGPWLSFYRKGNNRESIDTLIKKTFVFRAFDLEKDVDAAKRIDSCNAVAVHVRRGDALYSNAWCYKYGYFRRAVRLIRKNVDNPVFVFFTDPASVDWCKDHEDIFGISPTKDKMMFVDWHKGEDSYRDMQLMSHCKHAIITTSSFGWWGAYLIANPNKITISAYRTIDTTHHV